MADDEQLSKEHNYGDAGGDDKNSSPSPPPKKHKVAEESRGTEDEEGDAGGDDKNSSPSPPPKKHNVDEESHGTEEEEEDEEEEDAVADADEAENDSNGCFTFADDQWETLKHDYCPEGVEELDEDVWRKYLQEIKESEGFDIYHYPGQCWMAQYNPLNVDEKTSSTLKALIEFSNAAIADFNQKEQTKYKFEKVEKANAQLWDIGVNYYITFQAKDSVVDSFNTFQTLVWEGPGRGSESMVVKFCRLKLSTAT